VDDEVVSGEYEEGWRIELDTDKMWDSATMSQSDLEACQSWVREGLMGMGMLQTSQW
jgi:hypothetical protein